MEAPIFTEQLRPLRALDGEKVVLTCGVTGRPMPEIYWYHNGKMIGSNDDVTKRYDPQTGRCELLIAECFPEDTGQYKCLATNAIGENVTTAQLIVTVASDGYTCTSETSTSDDQLYRRSKAKTITKTSKTLLKAPPTEPEERRHSVTLKLPAKERPHEEVVVMVDVPPSLTRPPPQTQAQAEELITRPVPIAMSTPDLALAHKTELVTKVREHRPKRRRRPVESPTKVSQLTKPGRKMLLEIPGSQGERRYSETLVIDRPPEPVTIEIATVTQQTEQQMPLTEMEHSDEITQMHHIEHTTEMTKTQSQTGSDMNESLKETLRRQAEERKLAEQREREIREHVLKSRHEMSAEQTTVDETTKEKTSEPTVEIEEEKSLQVRTWGVLEDPNLAPAHFEQPTRPLVVREGEHGQFSAIISGKPVPKVKWLLDRQEVRQSDRVHINFNSETQETTLDIYDVRDSDQGNYTCQATNSISRANSTSNLVVVRKYKGHFKVKMTTF